MLLMLLNLKRYKGGVRIPFEAQRIGVKERALITRCTLTPFLFIVSIIDFIGAYTWYKRIESKGKTTLRGAKDNVTVLPPQQYKTRFREAMERYFLAVPGMFHCLWLCSVSERWRDAMCLGTGRMF